MSKGRGVDDFMRWRKLGPGKANPEVDELDNSIRSIDKGDRNT